MYTLCCSRSHGYSGTLRSTCSGTDLELGNLIIIIEQLVNITVKPPNKGHFGNNINLAVLSLIERLSSSRRFSMNRNYTKWYVVFGIPNSVPYIVAILDA